MKQKYMQQSLAECKFGQNTEFIYRTVPGIASNLSIILRNASLQFTKVFYIHQHSYSQLSKCGFLHEIGFFRLKFSTSPFRQSSVLQDINSIYFPLLECNFESAWEPSHYPDLGSALGRFPFNKNFGLKFWKPHELNGTVHSG